MTPLLALALAAAPGCPGALAEAEALARAPAARAPDLARALVDRLEAVGAGGPVDAVRREAEGLAAPGAGVDPAGTAAAFRRALARHCELAAAPAPGGPAAADRDALAAILARPEYARTAADPDALRRALLRLWEDLLERLGTSEAERWASGGRAVFLGAAAAAALLAALARRRGRRDRPRLAPAAPARTAAGVRDPTPADAEDALAGGDAREAVRRALLAALAALERAGAVEGGRSLTNGEVVARVSAAPGSALAADLAALARAFDGAIYGGRPVSAGDARAAIARARAVADGAADGAR